jgi:hypothetical protein
VIPAGICLLAPRPGRRGPELEPPAGGGLLRLLTVVSIGTCAFAHSSAGVDLAIHIDLKGSLRLSGTAEVRLRESHDTSRRPAAGTSQQHSTGRRLPDHTHHLEGTKG